MARKRPLGRACAIAVLTCLAACSGEVAAPGVIGAPLLNGSLDEGDPGVVALLSHGNAYCTGTLIASRVVVTAAHCIAEGMPDAVFCGAAIHRGGRTVPVERARAHPWFDAEVPGGGALHDIGALWLAADAPLDAAVVRPLDPSRAQANLVAGAPLRLVGFGGESPLPGATGIKRAGPTTIDAADDRTFRHSANPARTCGGDSGGPALIVIDGLEYLAGVASGGDADCTEYGVHTRVDAYLDEFLRHFPEPTATLGERCHQDGNCTTSLCLPAVSPNAFAYCSTPCRSDGDCAAGLHCVRDPDGLRVCRHDQPEPGALGSRCGRSADCASMHCGRSETASSSTCTLPCAPSDQVACPDGYVCAPDIAAPGDHGCFVPAPASSDEQAPFGSAGAGGASAHQAPDVPAACSAAAPRPSAGATWQVPAALLFVLILSARWTRMPRAGLAWLRRFRRGSALPITVALVAVTALVLSPASAEVRGRHAAWPVAAPVSELVRLELSPRLGAYAANDAAWVPGLPLVVNRDFDFEMALNLPAVGAGMAAAQRRRENAEFAARLSALGPIEPQALLQQACGEQSSACAKLAGMRVRVYGLLFGARTARLHVMLELAGAESHGPIHEFVSAPVVLDRFVEPGLLRRTFVAELTRALGQAAGPPRRGEADHPQLPRERRTVAPHIE